MTRESLLSPKIAELEPSATEEVDNLVKKMRQEGVKDIISLGAGEPCFDTPDNIKKAAWEALKGGKTKYEPTAGDYQLREEISKKLREENNIRAGVDDIMVTPGGKFAVFLAFQAMLTERSRVMILEPAWVSYEPAARIAGADVVRVASSGADGFQPNVEAIRKAMDSSIKIIVINSPNNPTGAVYDESVIRSIVEIAREHGALVLSDEIYEYLIYKGKHYSPGSEFDNVITVNGFSKSYAMTGWRLGYVTAPRELLEGMSKVYQHSVSCVTAFAQSGAIEALRNEKSREATNQMVQGYQERRDIMLKLIAQSEFLECVEPEGAFYCFPKYRFGKTSVQLAKELLEEVHVATVPGGAFGCEGYLRLSYATQPELIVEAFRRMENYFKEHQDAG